MSQGAGWAFLTVFGAGIATSLTPCVYPMIPITVSIFGAKEARSRMSAFLLATFYVLGIAVMYTGLGVLASLGGWAAGGILGSPYFVVPLAIFFVVMASSMFGFWEIRLPMALQNRMSQVGGKGFRGAFAMGLVGGVLIAPCTGPVLAGLLAYVATTGSLVMGAGLLFTYALGIGVLFWIIATFAVSMPKNGPWMDSVKSVLGIALLAAALYYLQPVVPLLSRFTAPATWFPATMAGLIVLGLILGALHLSYLGTSALTKIRKTLGILAITVATLGLINYALTPTVQLPWLANEAQALSLAKEQNKRLLVDFSAKWCVPCKEMEDEILTHPKVLKQLESWLLLKIDITDDSKQDQAHQKKYRAAELPQIILLGRDGKEQGRTGKVTDPEVMLKLLRKVR
ncbi:MAG: thioredoxin family protein [Deltaproteobacteria bacterium]|nr:thioredoxin family protein [Deltaproteobacteria bacterium]